MSGQRFVTGSRDQVFLLAPDMREWLPQEHLVWVVVDALERCQTAALRAAYRDDGQGRPAYDPVVLAALLVYAYAVGERSSRAIERRCREDVAFRVAAAGLSPDHVTIARFRRRHAEALIGLFSQVLRLCAGAGLVRIGLVAVDGTKIRADANRDRLERLDPEPAVGALLDEAEQLDAAEDALDEETQRALRGLAPASLGTAQERRARFDEAARSLAPPDRVPAPDEPSENAASWSRAALSVAERGPGGAAAVARALAQRRRGRRNATDPDSRIMRGANGFVLGYNAQLAVDESHLIVACDVCQEGHDNHQLEPMIERTEQALIKAGVRQRVGWYLADAGYWKGDTVEALLERGTRVLVPPNGRPRTSRVNTSPRVDRMNRRLRHPSNRRRYRRRQALVEPVVAHNKVGRRLDRFRLRGLPGAQLEWTLTCIGHNLARLAAHQHAA